MHTSTWRTVFSGSKYAACRNEHTDGNRHRISDAGILKLCDRLFGYTQNIGKKKRRGSTEKARLPLNHPAEAADEDFADDLELVAVISAAIAAYENTSGDSFVVRSIKKSNKWQSLTGGFEMKTYTITVNGTAYDVTVEEEKWEARQQHQRQLESSTKKQLQKQLRRQQVQVPLK